MSIFLNSGLLRPQVWIGFSLGILLLLKQWLTPYMLAATFAYLLMVGGLYYRKQRQAHPKWMMAAIFLDLGIVLTLELQRHAIETALSFSLTPLQQAHIGFSSVATVLYFPVLFSGIACDRGWFKEIKNKRQWHLKLGLTAFVFRTIGFLLMFSLLGRPQS